MTIEKTPQEIENLVKLLVKVGKEKGTCAFDLTHEEIFPALLEQNINRIRFLLTDDLEERGISAVYKRGGTGYAFVVPESMLQKPEPAVDSSAMPFMSSSDIMDVTHTFTNFENKNYICPPEFSIVECAIRSGDIPVLYGPPGSGKSRMGEQIGVALGLPTLRMTLANTRDPSELLGCDQAVCENGVTVTKFVKGPLAVAYEKGYLIIGDEFDVVNPDNMAAFQQVTESQGVLTIYTEKGPQTIERHPNFRMIFTGNRRGNGDDTGLFANSKPQNLGFLSRLGPYVPLGYNAEIEQRIIEEYHLPTAVMDALYSKHPTDKEKDGIFRIIRRACDRDGEINYQLHTRQIIRFAKHYAELGWHLAMYYYILTDFPEEYWGTIKEIIKKRLEEKCVPTNDPEEIEKYKPILEAEGF